MKDFKIWTFLSAFWIIALVAIFCLLCEFSYEEGNIGSGFSGMVFYLSAKLAWSFLFPFAYFILNTISDSSSVNTIWFMIILIAIDCLFYALLIERLFYLRRRNKKVIDPLH
jgi:hypothetical protein